MPSKIWIAKNDIILGGIESAYDHLYLVYDPDGFPSSGDEFVFRGGPDDSAKIAIEDWVPIQDSKDKLDGQNPFAARNYTELNLNGSTPEQFKQNASNWASSLGNRDTNGIINTNIPYTLPLELATPNSSNPALNSNTTIKSVLANSGVNLASNLPMEFGTGPRMPAGKFAGAESYYTASDSTVDITNSVDRVIFSTDGNNTYVVNASAANTGKVFIVEDHQSGTLDKLVINNVFPSDVRYDRGIDGSLNIYFPWDAEGDPSIVIPNQWKDGIPAINNLWIYPPDGSAPTIIPVTLPESVPLNLLPDFLPTWLQGARDQYAKGPYGLSPLVLDLDGDGVEVSQLGYGTTGSTAYFDMNNDGFAERTAWANGGDGMLAIDRNGNGKIDNQSELFGNYESYADGFANLKQYDSNNDNKITSLDTQFANLRVWVDANNNGISDSGELKTLASLQITQINLTQQAATETYINGNHVSGQSSFVMNGISKTISDVWFMNDIMDSRFLGDVTLDVRTLFLPTLKGFGGLKDLHVEMSEDTSLLTLVQNFVSGWSPTKFGSLELGTEIQNIMFKWAGVENTYMDITLSSNYGTYASPYDSRVVSFMQQITGHPFTEAELSTQPEQQMYMTLFAFNEIFNTFKSQLIVQVDGDALFDTVPHYSLITGDLTDGSLSQAGIASLISVAAGSGHTNDYWRDVLSTLFLVKDPEEYSSQEVLSIQNAITSSGATQTWGQYIDLVLNNSYGSSLLQGRATMWGDNTYMDVHLVGSNGSDTIQGSIGNDLLEGRGHSDALRGHQGDDILDGGRGDDIVEGGEGNDTYIYTYGLDTFREAQGTDTIIVKSNFTANDATFKRDTQGNEATLNIYLKGNLSIVISDQFSQPYTGIEKITFKDSTEINLSLFAPNIIGYAGNDVLTGADYSLLKDDALYGNNGNDTMTGGKGNDLLDGGTGNDNYIFKLGDGIDIIKDAGGLDTIQFASDIIKSSVQFGRINGNLIIYYGASDQIVIKNHYYELVNPYANPGYKIETLKFSDATTIDLTTITTFVGTSGEDLIFGTSWHDTLKGLAGNDEILGLAGNDILNGGAGDDYLDGGDGNDTVSYTDTISVVTVNLSLTSTQDTTGSGYDTLHSIENLIGSSYNDILTGDNNSNTIEGGLGNDLLNGGTGIDTVSYAGATSATTVSLAVTAAQNTVSSGTDAITAFENILGSAYNDTLTGDALANTIDGGLGNDTLNGGAGNDTLIGNTGVDTISYAGAASAITVSLAITAAQNTGGAGTDTILSSENLIGSSYNDTLTGNENANTLQGGLGNDTLNGGAGIDTVSYAGATSATTVSLAVTAAQNTVSSGTDAITAFENILGSAYNDTLTGDALANTIDGGLGNDTLNGGAGNDTLIGNTGVDTISYAGAASAITVSLAITAAQNTGGAGTDIILSSENLIGSYYNDVLTGDANANMIEGGLGNDNLNGGGGVDTVSYSSSTSSVTVNLAITTAQNTVGAGTDTIIAFENILGSAYNDTLTGDANANTITGADGNDTIQGGLGNDVLIGGNGVDTVSYSAATAAITFSLATTTAQNTVSAGTDTVSGFENILGSAYSDTLTGDANANTIEGGLGNDTLNGGAGIDTVSYASATAAVTVNLSSTVAQNTVGAGTDTLSNFENIFASAFNDTLTGNSAANTINGGAGNDLIVGGLGADILTGGLGADTFQFLSTGLDANFDRITDFGTAQADKIDVKNILVGFDAVTSAITNFIEFTTSGANTVVKVDRDGIGTTYGWQQVAQLDNVTGLTDEAALRASGNLIVA